MIKLNMSLQHRQRRTSLQLGHRLGCLSKELEVHLYCFSNPQFSHPLNENNNSRNHSVPSVATDAVSEDQFLQQSVQIPQEVGVLVDPRCVEQDLGPTAAGPYIIDWGCEGLTKSCC